MYGIKILDHCKVHGIKPVSMKLRVGHTKLLQVTEVRGQ